MAAKDDYARVEVTERSQWRRWLSRNHERAEGIWLVTYKKHCGDRYLPYDAVVEEALCFGWIDSLPRRLDADRTMLLLTPRRPGSPWSRLNKQRVAALEDAGRIAPSGRTKIEAAREDGSWTVLDEVEDLVVPDDLASALDGETGARSGYEALSPSVKKGILWWIKSAKRPTTRADRIARTVRAARAHTSPL
jgi:uncharacterized protein YdeI (YjbR/CyaY-like superfamily)